MGKFTIPRSVAATDKFPDNCMICVDNKPTVKRLQKFTFYPLWTYIGLIAGLIPAVILQMIFKKEDTVNLHLCDECNKKNKALPVFGCLMALGCFSLFIFSIVLFSNDQAILGFFALILSIAAPVAYYIMHNLKWVIHCSNMDDNNIELKVPNEKYPVIYEDYIAGEFSAAGPFCRNCGTKNIAESRFCEKCGQAM